MKSKVIGVRDLMETQGAGSHPPQYDTLTRLTLYIPESVLSGALTAAEASVLCWFGAISVTLLTWFDGRKYRNPKLLV